MKSHRAVDNHRTDDVAVDVRACDRTRDVPYIPYPLTGGTCASAGPVAIVASKNSSMLCTDSGCQFFVRVWRQGGGRSPDRRRQYVC